ncbi:probable starch synthase 4, chloroplastic/amyloplastic isoform X1 [Salvia splendens]|uniref:probable starch synthase 4, chloroplastic/amyloplastic isoform X1 n=1 Tax=Salvia splendens TaxID=180675 RepID=UPI001C2682EF|nr:probable starch synthase 4, chloroplastic/amyloplastic isoform X1 [Salvia splendens]
MEILVTTSTPRFPFPPHISKTHRKCSMPQILNCSRNTGESNGLSKAPISRELGSLDVDDDGKEERKRNDIWQLFEEAQQNIMYLNKQRLLAMEELGRVKNERNSLLQRIEQLEMQNQATARKDKLTICSELLLRIDALVLNGVIGSTEASDLRGLVIDSRVGLADDIHDIILKNDAEFLAELRRFSKTTKGNGFHIIHICTEMSPVVSVGSLAPYITGLSCALQRKGNLVEVILPKYACLNLDEVNGLREVEAEFYSYFNGQLHGNKIWTGVVYGIGVTFIEPVYYSSFFSHDKVYGYSNDFERFTYFSRASLDYLVKLGKRPDVLHVHNWQTSLVGPLFWDVFVNQGFESTRIVLTCQGFDSQSLEQPEKLALCGLDPSTLLRPDRLQDNNKSHLVNVLKGGVVYSNKVIIMSSVHTKGHIISALGHGLEPTLALQKEKLVISPSGFDKMTWDPSRDNFLPQHYSADDMEGKLICKFALQRHLGLEEGASNILVGCIYIGMSEDFDKLKKLCWMASSKGVQFVFMRYGQIPGMTTSFEIFQAEVKDKNVRFIDEYDEGLSHLIISGSDIMLCPSLDDHLLQVPLKAIKYGTAPIPVNFPDSIFRDFGNDSSERSRFAQYINSAFGNMSLGQALDEIKYNPLEWNRRIKDGMMKDFSWESECTEVHISAYEVVKKL